MRISREYFFDMVELVGRAITTARLKPADDSWLDDIIPKWMPKLPKEEIHKPGQDEFGLFSGTPWASTSDSERTDLSTVVPDAGFNFGFGPTERKTASRNKHDYGDSISCELWELQRKVRFKEVGVMDALKDLQQLCRRLAKIFISEGWANRLTQIIDECSP